MSEWGISIVYRKILFDFDGTLVDSRSVAIAATQEAFRLHSLPVPSPHEIERSMGIPIERSFPEFAGVSVLDRKLDDLYATFRSIYAKHSHDMRLFPDVPWLLQQLFSAGKSLALVTSKNSKVALADLTRLRINSHFSAVVGSDSVREYKPHPEPALLAIQRLGPDGKAIVVGDSCFDIEMGKAAKVATCAVSWGAHSMEDLIATQPDYLVSSVQELANILLHGNEK